jgi:hypothetical protein
MDPTTASDPALDSARMDGFYTDLATMQMELDADPLELGPKRLNQKISECRGFLTRCERIFLSLSQDLHRYKKALRAAKADMHLAKMDLFANDPEVRMGRNVADREAIASNRLRPEAEEIDRLTACVEDLSAVVVVVKAKRADLKDAQGRLKDQLKVCQEEISLGGRWGRSFPNVRKLHESALDPAQDEVNNLFATVLKNKKDQEAKELPPTEEDLPIPGDTEEPEALEESEIPVEFAGDTELSVEDALSNIPNTKSSLELQETPVMFEDGAIDDDLFSALG